MNYESVNWLGSSGVGEGKRKAGPLCCATMDDVVSGSLQERGISHGIIHQIRS